MEDQDLNDEQSEEIPASEEITADEPADEQKTPALVINIHSWYTPLVGILMLVVGLLAGYYLRPTIEQRQMAVASTTQQANAGSETTSQQTTSSEANSQNVELMDLVIAQTRHFKGSEDAPVTIVEISDFM